MKPMMKCGHAANAVDKDGNPCCAICAGFTPNAFIVDDSAPDLTGRRITTCHKLPKALSNTGSTTLSEYGEKII